ncbi:hypothetical protein C8N32_1142 [Rhodovulum imhoffii]|uniref:Uncharacterized protein n=1 Tax=Rhodovulum imhoffii TaxID=365340 RepID=A0A2T5BQ93_9RHOB|nr:hypothetical protein [Rhodovulum imhoffii]MBK5933715.1 hypothetical protein [Rhodovulum imhoffii]PTN01303.1 hypothetical protein C8N32_1142 [Rhodovulum imhoffii]
MRIEGGRIWIESKSAGYWLSKSKLQNLFDSEEWLSEMRQVHDLSARVMIQALTVSGCDFDARLVEQYQAGALVSELMGKHGVSHARVQKALEGRGINISRGNHLRKASDAEFTAAFLAGKNDAQISREMNVDRGTVRKRRAKLTARG